MKTSIGADTIVYPSPTFVVGTYDSEGKPNMAAVAWAGICCSRPPCVAVSLRKATYSYGSIVARQAFTVCIPSEQYVVEADYVGIKSGHKVNKFEVTGLTPVRSELVDAPYVAEFPMVLECKLVHTYVLGLHTQFVGEIMDVKVEQDMLTADGAPDIERIRPIIFASGNNAYYGVGRLLGEAFKIGRKLGTA